MKKFLQMIMVMLLSYGVTGQAAEKKSFTIKGYVKGEDAHQVYLNYRVEGKGMLDSFSVTKGRFTCMGYMSSPTQVHLSFHNFNSPYDPSNEADFYAEPGLMEFNGEMGHLDQSSLSGSASEKEYLKWMQQLRPLDDKINAIMIEWNLCLEGRSVKV